MTHTSLTLLLGVLLGALAVPAAQKLPEAVAADPKHYTVEFENDIVRLLRVRLPAGERAPAHSHAAYCAIELTDSSLREPNGPVSESKAGQVFCGDATSHAPQNVGEALAESVVAGRFGVTGRERRMSLMHLSNA